MPKLLEVQRSGKSCLLQKNQQQQRIGTQEGGKKSLVSLFVSMVAGTTYKALGLDHKAINTTEMKHECWQRR